MSPGTAFPTEANGLRKRLFWARFALGSGYRSCQITIGHGEADALAALFVRQGPLRVTSATMAALATLIHEEFHAVHYAGWPGIALEQLVDAPGLRQFSEGVIEAGVHGLLAPMLPRLGLGGLQKALPLLRSRVAYPAQHLAVRALLDHTATLLGVPLDELLRRAIRWGGRMVALRNLAHDIASAQRLEGRIPDWQWPVVRIQRDFPGCIEGTLMRDVLLPFEALGQWFASGELDPEQTVQAGINTGKAIIGALVSRLETKAA